MLLLSCTRVLLLQLALFNLLHGAEWTFIDEHQWPQSYPYCGGAFQSPIDLKPELLRFDPTLRPIDVQNYNLSSSEQLTFGNNGHSVQISLPSKMHISSLPHRYTAVQLHLHWGTATNLGGSEHLVNSKQYPAELHIVHYNSEKYPDISTALDKSDGLAVLGVLIDIGQFNPAFEKFLKYIDGIKYRGQKVQVPGFNIRALLPARLDEYYRYDGSLTTPPCYPSVLWTVFRNPVTISRKQFMALATQLSSSLAQDTAPVPMNGNYRKLHLPDSRVVLVSFKEGKEPHHTVTVTCSLQRKRLIQKLLVGDLDDLADGKHDLKNLQGGTLYNSLKQLLNPSLWNKNVVHHSGGKLGLVLDTLSYSAVEQRVSSNLQQSNTESELIKALRDVVFPELNLRSYLSCKSELAIATTRHILRGRGVVGTIPNINMQNHQNLSWIMPMEWED
ncbi:carbonic anhydrase 12 [Aulostomus maculatus]